MIPTPVILGALVLGGLFVASRSSDDSPAPPKPSPSDPTPNPSTSSVTYVESPSGMTVFRHDVALGIFKRLPSLEAHSVGTDVVVLATPAAGAPVPFDESAAGFVAAECSMGRSIWAPVSMALNTPSAELSIVAALAGENVPGLARLLRADEFVQFKMESSIPGAGVDLPPSGGSGSGSPIGDIPSALPSFPSLDTAHPAGGGPLLDVSRASIPYTQLPTDMREQFENALAIWDLAAATDIQTLVIGHGWTSAATVMQSKLAAERSAFQAAKSHYYAIPNFAAVVDKAIAAYDSAAVRNFADRLVGYPDVTKYLHAVADRIDHTSRPAGAPVSHGV